MKVETVPDDVLRFTRDKRVLMIGGTGTRPEQSHAIKRDLKTALFHWAMTDGEQGNFFKRIAHDMRPGKWDLILVLTKFVSHRSMDLVKAAKQFQIPVVNVTGGYHVTNLASAIQTQLSDGVPASVAPAKQADIPAPTPEVKHAPLDRYVEAAAWIRQNPREGFAQFSRTFPEVEFHTAWFSAQVRKMKMEVTPEISHVEEKSVESENNLTKENLSMPKKSLKGARPAKVAKAGNNNPESKRVRDYLAKLTPEKIKAMTYGGYVQKTGDKVAAYTYNNVRARLLQDAGLVNARVTRPRQTAPAFGRVVSVLAEIDLVKFKHIATKDIIALTYEILKTHRDISTLQVVVCSDPAMLEIREKAI